MYKILTLLALATAVFGQSQPTNAAKPGEALFEEMSNLDKRMFDSYNACRLDEFAATFGEGVEFYHDQGGVTLGVKNLVDSVKTNICGKVRRELIQGSLQVYPMKGFGALLVGRHRFHPSAPGSEATGVAQFIHLAQKTAAGWKVTRVYSFDHVGLATLKR